MTLRHSLLCLLALLIIVFLAFKNYDTWTSPLEALPGKAPSKKLLPKPEKSQAAGVQTGGALKDPKQSIAAYIFITEKNPFSPDRKEYPLPPPAGSPGVPQKPPIVRPQVTLYGVTVAGQYQSASISYSGRVLQKGERAIVTVQVGERVGDYTLTKILEDRIVLEAQGDSFEVLLYTGPKNRVATRTENKPATVTSTAAAAAAAPGPAPVAPGGGIQPAVTQMQAPISVTPAGAPIPNSRARRWSPRPGVTSE